VSQAPNDGAPLSSTPSSAAVIAFYTLRYRHEEICKQQQQCGPFGDTQKIRRNRKINVLYYPVKIMWI
jgi:hypothetical protein